MNRKEKRRERWKSSIRPGGSVNLISMMDILTTLLLFLLKSYAGDAEVMVPPSGIQLPSSTAEQVPQSSLVVAIDHDDIRVGGERIASVAEAVNGEGLEIAALTERLRAIRSQDAEAARGGSGPAGARMVTIQGDRDLEYRLLRKVMFTLGESGFEQVSLAVLRST